MNQQRTRPRSGRWSHLLVLAATFTSLLALPAVSIAGHGVLCQCDQCQHAWDGYCDEQGCGCDASGDGSCDASGTCSQRKKGGLLTDFIGSLETFITGRRGKPLVGRHHAAVACDGHCDSTPSDFVDPNYSDDLAPTVVVPRLRRVIPRGMSNGVPTPRSMITEDGSSETVVAPYGATDATSGGAGDPPSMTPVPSGENLEIEPAEPPTLPDRLNDPFLDDPGNGAARSTKRPVRSAGHRQVTDQ
jgi:hypothetical protein